MGPFFGVSSQWDNVSVTGRARGGRTHRDTEEGEAEEQAAKARQESPINQHAVLLQIITNQTL